jgi:hypothetical protein
MIELKKKLIWVKIVLRFPAALIGLMNRRRRLQREDQTIAARSGVVTEAVDGSEVRLAHDPATAWV